MSNSYPDWVIRGKSIKELIDDLSSFENQEMQVRISLDGGKTSKPISIVKKSNGLCIIANSEIFE
ncbi:hypothetical protein NRY95_01075 [Xanthomonas campestris pv. phormiicola]|nr:hypothetical protein [Xanthomonas campestris pv. phormiicola]UYC16607.1 hypothetical protein NRY95_01075 [Xanthomonas campestris pv. phormiicola]